MHRGKLFPDITVGTDASVVSSHVTQSGGGQLPMRISPDIMDALFWEAPQDFFVVRICAAQEDVAVPRDSWGKPQVVTRPP